MARESALGQPDNDHQERNIWLLEYKQRDPIYFGREKLTTEVGLVVLSAQRKPNKANPSNGPGDLVLYNTAVVYLQGARHP
jgi:hypothetical protein